MKLFSKRVRYTTLNRRGYDIILPTDVYQMLQEKKINIGLAITKNSMTVQCTKNKHYLGTLKECMGITRFKNGNPCDFHMSNVITED